MKPALTRPTLTYDGVILRPAGPADADAIVAACQDPEIPRWTSVPSPYHREDALSYLERVDDGARDGTMAGFLAFDVEGRLLGSFSILEIDRVRGYGEIGYWLAAEARGRGLATRTVLRLRDWAVSELGLERLEILADRDNHRSQRVAERAGFSATGEVRPFPRTEDPGEPRCLVYLWTAS